MKTIRSTTTLIDGVGGQINSAETCIISLKSRNSQFEISVKVDVVPQSAIKYTIPPDEAYLDSTELANIPLAEKKLKYHSVDMILGNEYYNRCVLTATATFDGILFQQTNFGWTATSPIPARTSGNTLFSFTSTREIEDDLTRFWEIEEVLPIQIVKPEHELCEHHFENTFTRAEDGRFVIHLLLKESPSSLGEPRTRALRSLLNSEKKTKS